MNALFVKSLYKIARVMLVLYIGLQAKTVLSLKISCHILRSFKWYYFLQFLFTIISGDFKVRSSVWWTKDKTTMEGTQLESLPTVHVFHQLILQSKHLLPQTSSCIDLIFTDQPNLIVDSDVHPSLHSNCHHQITYCKFNLSIEYPPPYEHLVWDCNRANVEGIKGPIESVNWEVMFNNKSLHKQVSIVNERHWWTYFQTLLQTNFLHLIIGTSLGWMIL